MSRGECFAYRGTVYVFQSFRLVGSEVLVYATREGSSIIKTLKFPSDYQALIY